MGANWQEVANAVIQRRVELGYETRKEFIEGSGIGARTIGDIETARRESYDPATLARLEKALRWPAGKIQKVLNTPLPTEPADVATEMMTASGVYAHLYSEKLDLAHLIANSPLDAEQRFNIIREHRRRQNEFMQAEEERIRAEIENLAGS